MSLYPICLTRSKKEVQKAANKKRVYFVLRNGNSRDTDSGETVEGGQRVRGL